MTTITRDADMLALAKRFFAAVTAGDIKAVRACYAEDAIIWHNTDGISQSVDENCCFAAPAAERPKIIARNVAISIIPLARGRSCARSISGRMPYFDGPKKAL